MSLQPTEVLSPEEASRVRERLVKRDLSFKEFEIRRRQKLGEITKLDMQEKESDDVLAESVPVPVVSAPSAPLALGGLLGLEGHLPPLMRKAQPREWYKIRQEDEVVTAAEAAIAKNEIMQRETTIVAEWGRQARELMALGAKESAMRDQAELERLRTSVKLREMEEERAFLEVETMAAIINRKQRKTAKHFHRLESLKRERGILKAAHRARNELAQEVWQRNQQRNEEVRSIFQSGPQLVSRFGTVLAQASRSMAADTKEELMTRLHTEGLSLGRVKATDAASMMHRKITLNPLDMAEGLRLANGDLTVTHVAPKANWGMVRATEGPWMVRQQQHSAVRDMVQQAKRDLPSQTSVGAIRSLANVLDAAHPSHALHAAVLSKPNQARALVTERLKALGYTAARSFTDTYNDAAVKETVENILDQLDERISVSSRFYCEIHASVQTGLGTAELSGSASQLLGIDGFDDEPGTLLADSGASAAPKWIVGWSLGRLRISQHSYPGRDEESFGFCWDGSVIHRNVRRPYCSASVLRSAHLVGLVADLNSGTLSLTADGHDLGPGFGVDATPWSPDEGLEQGKVFRSEALLPSFALRGPDLPAGSKLYDSDGSDGEHASARPSLSVNFGGFPFLHLPEGAFACDAFLSLQSDSHTPAMELPALPSSTSTRPWVVEEADERKSRHDFIESLRYPGPAQFSFYPKPQHRRAEAARSIQRAWRWYAGRKWRYIESARQRWAVIKLQAWWRRWWNRRCRMMHKAAIVLQRFWRGYRVRSVFPLALMYGLPPDELDDAAFVIQQCWRMHKSHQGALLNARAAERELSALVERVLLIQRIYRGHRARQDHERQSLAAGRIQAAVRGWRVRKSLPSSWQIGFSRLRLVLSHLFAARNVRKRDDAARLIQNAWKAVQAKQLTLREEKVKIACAIRIQAVFRGWLGRNRLAQTLTYGQLMFVSTVEQHLIDCHFVLSSYQPCNLVCPV